jgi:hypothetical protein
MFTVVLGRESSGANNTCKPLLSAYSVTPSTDVTLLMPAGKVVAVAVDSGNSQLMARTKTQTKKCVNCRTGAVMARAPM